MADSPRKGPAWVWLALGVGLSLLPLWAHPLSLAGALLAQPPLALGLAGVRGLRPVTLDAAGRRDALALALVWAAALALVALAVG